MMAMSTSAHRSLLAMTCPETVIEALFAKPCTQGSNLVSFPLRPWRLCESSTFPHRYLTLQLG